VQIVPPASLTEIDSPAAIALLRQDKPILRKSSIKGEIPLIEVLF
jgi:hypothetical protein